MGFSGRVLVLFVALQAFACNQNQPCGDTSANVTGSDGGSVTCAVSDDCPRPADGMLCTQNRPDPYACVICENQVCVQRTPLICR